MIVFKFSIRLLPLCFDDDYDYDCDYERYYSYGYHKISLDVNLCQIVNYEESKAI